MITAPKFVAAGTSVRICSRNGTYPFAEARDAPAARRIVTALNLPHEFAQAAAAETGRPAQLLLQIGENIADMLFLGEQL